VWQFRQFRPQSDTEMPCHFNLIPPAAATAHVICTWKVKGRRRRVGCAGTTFIVDGKFLSTCWKAQQVPKSAPAGSASMSSLDPTRSLPPLKSFSLTHILYDPTHPLSIPLTLLSLTPIFLFVSYLTLLIFTRRLTIVFLALGSLSNETLNLVLKRIWRADRPWKGHGEVGEGYGMPSSHTQAAAFLVAWSIGYALTSERRYTQGTKASGRLALVRTVRKGIWVFGVVLWSILVAYSRYVREPNTQISSSKPLSGLALREAPLIVVGGTSITTRLCRS
jgi:membrane-associated phospholipid phosphatase